MMSLRSRSMALLFKKRSDGTGAMSALLLMALVFLSMDADFVRYAGAWEPGHATYYGGDDASGTNGGSCGYGNQFELGFGTMTAAISDMIYEEGTACGACYEIRCKACPYSGSCTSSTVTVTATNESPQVTTDVPGPHFDLSQPAFNTIADESAGEIVVEYQRVTCARNGGIHFEILGQTYFMQVLIYNVGGAGDVQSLSVKGSSSSDWIDLARLWGSNWSTGAILDGQALCFKVTLSDGNTLVSNDVAGTDWQYGQTFEGGQF